MSSIARSVLETVARALTSNYDVEIRFEGNKCMTNGKIITLPMLPDNVPEKLIKMIRGYMDHEIGHVIFTDFAVTQSMRNKLEHSAWNAVEDVWIELGMERIYRGCAVNFEKLDVEITPKVVESWSSYENIRKVLVGVYIVARYGWDHPLFSGVGAEVLPVLRRLESEIAASRTLTSSKDALALGRRILEKLREMSTESPPDDAGGDESDSESSDDNKGDESRKSSEKSSSKKDEESEEESDGDKSDDDGDDSEKSSDKSSDGDSDSSDGADDRGDSGDESDSSDGEDGDGSSGDTDSDEEGSESEKGKSSSDGSSGGEGDSESDDGDGSSADAEDLDSASASASDAEGSSRSKSSDEELSSDMKEALRDGLERVNEERKGPDLKEMISTEASSSKGYRPYSTKKDTFEPVAPYSNGLDRYNKSAKRLSNVVTVLKNELTRLLLSQKRSRWIGGKREGLLNPSMLHHVINNTSDQVYRQMREGRKINTAVEILVDLSGSMSSRLEAARETVIVLAETLSLINVPFEIIGFTGDFKWFNYVGDGYSRWGSLDHFYFKLFDEPFGIEQKARIGSMRAHHQNYDGESVQFAANRVLQRKERKKVLFVLSDGEPWAGCCKGFELVPHLRQVVKDLEAIPDLYVAGFGIETDAPSKFYKNHVLVNNLAELPRVLMDALYKVFVLQ